MTEHTPGPWRADYNFIRPAEDIDKRPSIAVVRFCQEGGADPETAANARLIAAAPDLLAALESVCAEGPKKPPHPYASDAMHKRWRIFELARAAIAKARGE